MRTIENANCGGDHLGSAFLILGRHFSFPVRDAIDGGRPAAGSWGKTPENPGAADEKDHLWGGSGGWCHSCTSVIQCNHRHDCGLGQCRPDESGTGIRDRHGGQYRDHHDCTADCLQFDGLYYPDHCHRLCDADLVPETDLEESGLCTFGLRDPDAGHEYDEQRGDPAAAGSPDRGNPG